MEAAQCSALVWRRATKQEVSKQRKRGNSQHKWVPPNRIGNDTSRARRRHFGNCLQTLRADIAWSIVALRMTLYNVFIGHPRNWGNCDAICARNIFQKATYTVSLRQFLCTSLLYWIKHLFLCLKCFIYRNNYAFSGLHSCLTWVVIFSCANSSSNLSLKCSLSKCYWLFRQC